MAHQAGTAELDKAASSKVRRDGRKGMVKVVGLVKDAAGLAALCGRSRAIC